MPAKKKSLSRNIIGSNLAEATQEPAGLLQRLSHDELKEEELQIGLLHAYHHLNVAWNARFAAREQYAQEKQFKKWGKYPAKIETL